MRIIWATNPLETRVELNESDRLLLHERLKTEYLENKIVAVSLELDLKRHTESTLENRIAAALQTLDVNYSLDGIKRKNKTLNQWLSERVVEYEKSLLDKHFGDCTCLPCSCLKCHAEYMLNIDTIDGLDKHSAYKIDAAFKGNASINEAIERLASYQPIYNPASKWSKEDWEKHVSRWIEEAKQARKWLVAYKDMYLGGIQ
jgi:hypothetical protein